MLVLHRDTVVVVSVRFVAVVVEFVSFRFVSVRFDSVRFGSIRFDFRHHKRFWDDEHNTESKQTAIADPTLVPTLSLKTKVDIFLSTTAIIGIKKASWKWHEQRS